MKITQLTPIQLSRQTLRRIGYNGRLAGTSRRPDRSSEPSFASAATPGVASNTSAPAGKAEDDTRIC